MADGATSLEEDQAQFALMVALCASVICVGLWLSFLVSQVVYRLGWKKVLHARAGTFDCPHSLHNTAFPPLTLPPSSQHTHTTSSSLTLPPSTLHTHISRVHLHRARKVLCRHHHRLRHPLSLRTPISGRPRSARQLDAASITIPHAN